MLAGLGLGLAGLAMTMICCVPATDISVARQIGDVGGSRGDALDIYRAARKKKEKFH